MAVGSEEWRTTDLCLETSAGGPRAVDSQSIPGRAVINGQTIHVHDLYAVPESELRAGFLRKHNTRTVLATPLLCQGNPIGVIMIRRMEVRPFSDRQIALSQPLPIRL